MITMKKTGLYIFLTMLLALSACSAVPSDAVSTTAPAATSTATPTPTLMPTATDIPPLGILLAPPEADGQLVDFLQSSLAQAISEEGLRFQVLPSLDIDSFERDVIRWVVALSPAANLNQLVVASLQTRFLAVGIQGLDTAPNLSMIAPGGTNLGQQGFVAGYIAAMITPEWHVGVISVADSPAGQDARNAFLTGAEFHCGMCAPTYPPFLDYPLYVEAAASATTAEWQAAADVLLQRSVETVYVVPGAGDENLLRYLARSGVKIIGGAEHPADINDAWVATLTFSLSQAFVDFWPDFASGLDGQTVDVPLTITDIDDELLSIGRQRLVTNLIADVLAGYIDLGTDPLP